MKNLILEALKERNKNNPMTASDLKDLTGLNASINRCLIADLREEGFRIVSNKRGYFIADCETDYKEWRKGYLGKIRLMAKRVRAMDGYTEGQLEI